MTTIEAKENQKVAQDNLINELMASRRAVVIELAKAQLEIESLKAERDELLKTLELVRTHI